MPYSITHQTRHFVRSGSQQTWTFGDLARFIYEAEAAGFTNADEVNIPSEGIRFFSAEKHVALELPEVLV